MRSVFNAILMALACHAQSADAALEPSWRLLGETSDSFVFVDVESVRVLPPIEISRPFEVREAWVRYVDRQRGGRAFSLELIRVNCRDNSTLIRSALVYDEGGRVESSQTQQDYDFRYEPAAPGSVAMSVVDFVCGRSQVF